MSRATLGDAAISVAASSCSLLWSQLPFQYITETVKLQQETNVEKTELGGELFLFLS